MKNILIFCIFILGFGYVHTAHGQQFYAPQQPVIVGSNNFNSPFGDIHINIPIGYDFIGVHQMNNMHYAWFMYNNMLYQQPIHWGMHNGINTASVILSTVGAVLIQSSNAMQFGGFGGVTGFHQQSFIQQPFVQPFYYNPHRFYRQRFNCR
jgi:hypothetical protein